MCQGASQVGLTWWLTSDGDSYLDCASLSLWEAQPATCFQRSVVRVTAIVLERRNPSAKPATMVRRPAEPKERDSAGQGES